MSARSEASSNPNSTIIPINSTPTTNAATNHNNGVHITNNNNNNSLMNNNNNTTKVFLKIESMASRKERLMNNSRKF